MGAFYLVLSKENRLKKNVYILSGLGADERVFQKLDFSDFSATFINWQVPHFNETIGNYTSRLLAQITANCPVLIGLSFGGIMAIEIAKQIDTEKVILISSAKTRNEIPFYYRWAGLLGFHKLLPSKLLKHPNFLTNWFFGATSISDKKLLKEILRETDTKFLKWSIDKIVRWENIKLPLNFQHIHGTSDRILPYRLITCDIEIKNGGHFMIFNKPDELSGIIKQLI